jgi:hypothetical protein
MVDEIEGAEYELKIRGLYNIQDHFENAKTAILVDSLMDALRAGWKYDEVSAFAEYMDGGEADTATLYAVYRWMYANGYSI